MPWLYYQLGFLLKPDQAKCADQGRHDDGDDARQLRGHGHDARDVHVYARPHACARDVHGVHDARVHRS